MRMVTRMAKTAKGDRRSEPGNASVRLTRSQFDPRLRTLPRVQTARQAATLADDFAKLRVKQFDLEFTVDPLFKKTSADFDEGGAGGILMNHLGCDGSMKVVFDAGDAKLDCEEEEEDGAEAEGEGEQRKTAPEGEHLQLDLSKLKGKLSSLCTRPRST